MKTAVLYQDKNLQKHMKTVALRCWKIPSHLFWKAVMYFCLMGWTIHQKRDKLWNHYLIIAPNHFITSKQIITIDRDFESAIVCEDPEILNYYRKKS